jgi:hypothetical protein
LDSGGHPVNLSEISFIRIDVLSGVAEIDGIAGVEAVPEPKDWMLFATGLATLLGVRGTKGWTTSRRDRQTPHVS